jgi:hypothetical protein
LPSTTWTSLTHTRTEASEETSNAGLLAKSVQSLHHGTTWSVALVNLREESVGGLRRQDELSVRLPTSASLKGAYVTENSRRETRCDTTSKSDSEFVLLLSFLRCFAIRQLVTELVDRELAGRGVFSTWEEPIMEECDHSPVRWRMVSA